jgi:hypothetical protein
LKGIELSFANGAISGETYQKRPREAIKIEEHLLTTRAKMEPIICSARGQGDRFRVWGEGGDGFFASLQNDKG